MAFKIVALAGDGIGPEVMEAARRVLEAVAGTAGMVVDIEPALIGGAAIDACGDPFPQETRAAVDTADAVYLGAVGGPQWDHAPRRPEQGLLELRQHMQVWANLRPFDIWPGLEHLSPLRQASDVHGLIVRELTGGLYFGTPRGRKQVDGEEVAVDTLPYAAHEIRRLAQIAFAYARQHQLPVTLVDKANVLETSRLWRDIVRQVHDKEFAEVSWDSKYVDAAAMELVLAPQKYRVVLTENLFGDILSDLAGGIVGSLGLLGSASIKGYAGTPGLFEPVHGSAPDIAGKGIANPIGAISAMAWLIGWSFNQPQWQKTIECGIVRALQAGVRTPDMGGTDSTQTVTDRVIQEISQGCQRRKIS
ncbi:MAG: 3-isopropylmalate dehydrogenase [Firmicutes bacterium]|nr:3-isopropylmalate dehydrogenase [Bacillota bacterium]